jgi:hypothetical protein
LKVNESAPAVASAEVEVAADPETVWEGLPVRIFRGRMQKTLEESIEPGLGRLKAEAERRAS